MTLCRRLIAIDQLAVSTREQAGVHVHVSLVKLWDAFYGLPDLSEGNRAVNDGLP